MKGELEKMILDKRLKSVMFLLGESDCSAIVVGIDGRTYRGNGALPLDAMIGCLLQMSQSITVPPPPISPRTGASIPRSAAHKTAAYSGTAMAARELVMLAQEFELGRNRVAGMMVSEKLDGQRCIWVPETRGLLKSEVAWSNRNNKKDIVCTGLWSRYGNIIHCPDWFVSGWPTDVLLDGELWMGRGRHQECRSAIAKHKPVDTEWEGVKFWVFDRPPREQFYRPGRINNANYKCSFTHLMRGMVADPRDYVDFNTEYRLMKRDGLGDNEYIELLEQRLLTYATEQATLELREMMDSVVNGGGEGLIVRYTGSKWQPIRSAELLKYKPTRTGIATIIGFKAGIGRLSGMLGSLHVRWTNNNLEFYLGGLSDSERELLNGSAAEDGDYLHGVERTRTFAVGQAVMFEYRETTDAGLPKEAQFKGMA